MRESLICAHCGLTFEARAPSERTIATYCCIGCRLAASIAGEGDVANRSTRLLEARLMLSAFLAMGVMTFSLVLYAEPLYVDAEDAGMRALRPVLRLVLAMFSLPVFLLLGVPIAIGAWRDLALRRVRMDGLILLTAVAAYGLSIAHTLAGGGEVYFETVTMVLVVVTFGRRLEAHARTHGRGAADALAECLPESAHRIAPDVKDVAPDALQPGDLIEVLPGEAVPAEVCVTEGSSAVTVAHVTGEAAPVRVEVGDCVVAGSVNGTRRFEARVVRQWQEGGLGRIRDLLEGPVAATRSMRAIDRVAGYLAWVAIGLGVVGATLAYSRGGAGEALRTLLSVLLVACPCALGLATPLAYRAIRAALAKRGVLVHDAAALERAAGLDRAFLDKTGSLTAPSTELRACGSRHAVAQMQKLVAHSGHALGQAFARDGVGPRHLTVQPGRGVEIAAGDGSGTQRAGSPDWMDAEGVQWEPSLAEQRVEWERDGATLVAYADDGRVRALAAIDHRLRSGALQAARRLRRLGVDLTLLSGDHEEAVSRVARELDVEALSGLAPEDKVTHVESARARGERVLMFGDGMNDGPALRAADVGVAVGDGTVVARDQADVELLGEDVRGLPLLIEAARELRRTTRGNFAWSIAYNAVALACATAGYLHPLVAVSAMVISSLVVSVRSWRLLEFEGVRVEQPA